MSILDIFVNYSALFLTLFIVLFAIALVIILLQRQSYINGLNHLEQKHSEIETTLKKRLDGFTSILDAYPDPLVFKGHEGLFLWCNKALERLWKIPRGRIIGSKAEQLFPQHLDEILKMEKHLNASREILVKERKYTDEEGESRSIEITLMRLKDPMGDGHGVLTIFKDVSHYREQFENLNTLYEATREDLQKRSGYYADFLKTGLSPLNSILGDSDSLLHYEADQRQSRKILERISSSAEKMNSYIRNLSFLAFPEKTSALYESSSSDELPSLTLEDWQNQLIQRLAEISKAKNSASFVLLQGDIPESLATRIPLLNELLERLIENAEQYGQGGLFLIIRVNRIEAPFFSMNISLRNLGPAIPPEKREEIFDPFNKILGPEERPGLGLTVARSLAEKMGGSLSCDPSCKDGARFLLSLPPVKGAGTVISGNRLGGLVPGDARTILLADDDVAFASKLKTQVCHTGIQFIHCEDGLEADALLKEKKINLAIVDEVMPGLSGRDIHKRWQDAVYPTLEHCTILSPSYILDELDFQENEEMHKSLKKPLDWSQFLDLLLEI